MSSNRANVTQEQIESFCSVTGANNERARFYLEAANGDLDLAIGSFFEGGGAGESEEPEITEPSANRQQNYEMYDDEAEDSSNQGSSNPFNELLGLARGIKSSESKPKPKSSGASSKIFTLSSLGGDNDDDDEEEDEKGQAFYAGGSEHSGQQILGPPKKKNDNPDKIIKDLFQKARESGAQEVDQSEPTSKKTPTAYGAGYRLGTGNEPTEVIQGPPRPKPPKVSVLKLWKNGFNVDDGPLRSYTDPQNREFLQDIEKGQPPRELIRQAEGGEVHLDMQDHRDEEYEPPKNQYRLYNDGYKLGSPTPNVVSTASPNDQEANEKKAKQELGLDESKPSTQIQIRLSNGSRLIIKANQTHKISDLRRYINTARPEYSPRVYSLLTSFPNKEITNETETLQAANLLNAVIIQKLKE